MEKIENRIPLIYISGWMGNGKDSASYKWLERYFSNIDYYAAGGKTDVQQIVDELSQVIDRHSGEFEPILVGNSYGGFIASMFPNRQVLINPALFPSETLPHIADLSEEEIQRFRDWERRRKEFNNNEARKDTFCVCTEGDELIPDHRTEEVSANPPVMIPAGAHRLSDEQRDQYVLPLINYALDSAC